MGGGPITEQDEESAGRQAQLEEGKPDVTFFVTGFGPFPDGKGGIFERNASHCISKLLPSSMTVHVPVNSHAGKKTLKVKILNPTAEEGAYLPVDYGKIRRFMSSMYEEHRRSGTGSNSVDVHLHLGMADGWDFVSVERVAFKQGMRSSWWTPVERDAGYYMGKDVAGKTVVAAGPCPWDSLPCGLSTAFDVDSIVLEANKRNRGDAAKGDSLLVREHLEPGSYCCGFTYYESLAHCYNRGMRPNVLFCHVPGETDDESLKKGRDAIVAVIEAAAIQFDLIREHLRSG